MGSETSKGVPHRVRMGHFGKYLRGDTLDVGAGRDPLPAIASGMTVRAWDRQDGDAATLPGVPPMSYDAVYSSHCLEDMADVPSSLKRWVEVLKLGGYIYVVVPDFELYEHGGWPSRYNENHRHTFSLTVERERTGRYNHWGSRELSALFLSAGCAVEEFALEDWGYDRGITDGRDQTCGDAVAQIRLVARRVLRIVI
jgi:hypothetical protein